MELLLVKTIQGYELLKLAEIAAIFMDDGVLTILTESDRQILPVGKGLTDLEYHFVGRRQTQFFKIHRGAIINVNAIRGLYYLENGWVVVLRNNREFSVARSRKEELLLLLRPHQA